MGSAFVGALSIAIGVMALGGTGTSGTTTGLRLTARLSFAFFWLAYVGGAITNLFGPGFNIIALRVREFGLAFASAQLVHVGLVVWIAFISPHQSLKSAAMPFFAIGVAWTYLLAALSTERTRRTFNPHLLRMIRTIGSEYIALTFFTDFVLVPERPIHYLIVYIPFWGMLLVAPLLRLAAAAKAFNTWRTEITR